jgi:hypothetical protein
MANTSTATETGRQPEKILPCVISMQSTIFFQAIEVLIDYFKAPQDGVVQLATTVIAALWR